VRLSQMRAETIQIASIEELFGAFEGMLVRE
jgi:hypothetical protein